MDAGYWFYWNIYDVLRVLYCVSRYLMSMVIGLVRCLACIIICQPTPMVYYAPFLFLRRIHNDIFLAPLTLIGPL